MMKVREVMVWRWCDWGGGGGGGDGVVDEPGRGGHGFL